MRYAWYYRTTHQMLGGPSLNRVSGGICRLNTCETESRVRNMDSSERNFSREVLVRRCSGSLFQTLEYRMRKKDERVLLLARICSTFRR